ncbi:hypothetical protein HPB50_020381 [Hyalomma asiaticum]|uniref:Uncharacterized protein n=1 Tax=Hyalomma asiaticum TaxID=266040 RepID=A0ACB7SRH1_HYAAI|nr:hypothetical protein HPB50_020381 [Hyalomma asiaticum]
MRSTERRPESSSVGKVPCPTCDRFRWQRHVKSDEDAGEAGTTQACRRTYSLNEHFATEPMPFPASSVQYLGVWHDPCRVEDWRTLDNSPPPYCRRFRRCQSRRSARFDPILFLLLSDCARNGTAVASTHWQGRFTAHLRGFATRDLRFPVNVYRNGYGMVAGCRRWRRRIAVATIKALTFAANGVPGPSQVVTPPFGSRGRRMQTRVASLV